MQVIYRYEHNKGLEIHAAGMSAHAGGSCSGTAILQSDLFRSQSRFVLPRFVYSIPLTGAYRDSVYTVSLKYGEYIDMISDIANYNRLSGAVPPERVLPQQRVTECRKQGVLR